MEWRDIPGWEGLYRVSNDGLVKTLHKSPEGHVLRPATRGYGHAGVSLWRNGKQWSTYVHVLVLLAFVGPCPEGMECLHGNGNAGDNRLENLKWGTPSENGYDRVRHGTHPQVNKVECINRHPFTTENTKFDVKRNTRVCLTCKRARNAAYKAKQKAIREAC